MKINFKNTRYKIFEISNGIYQILEIENKRFLFFNYKIKSFLKKPYTTKDNRIIFYNATFYSLEESEKYLKEYIEKVNKYYNYPKLIKEL